MLKRRGGVVLVFLFLLSISFVVAMEDPITVQTDPENEVKVYAWPDGGGRLLNLEKGAANDEGYFTTTFFSLNEPFVKFQVLIIDSKGEKVKDANFPGTRTDEPIIFDCTVDVDCNLTYGEILTEEEDLVVEEPVVLAEENEPQPNIVRPYWSAGDFSFTERLDIQGTFGNWLYVAGGLLTFAVLFLVFFRFQQFKEFLLRINIFSEEGELLRLQAKIEHKQGLMQALKDKELRRKKIRAAETRLKKEGKKLESMVEKHVEKENRAEKRAARKAEKEAAGESKK